ncbi:MAG TPA: response regulator [Gemmatimonadales bacterium]|jgi:CheY-like chemotaxis protein|nr:response regulator [Gemmatimonadales bacterium]
MTPPRTPRGPRPPETTIVVVDDDPVTLTLVERTLRAEGYRVWTASRAADARKLLAELAGAVDLVLTDIAMPGGLGSELAAQIRSTQRWVRVLFMSSYSPEHLRKHGIEVPESQLLRKPFVAAQLMSRIREALTA